MSKHDFSNCHTFTALKEAHSKELRLGSEDYHSELNLVANLEAFHPKRFALQLKYQAFACQITNAALSRCFELLAQKESPQ